MLTEFEWILLCSINEIHRQEEVTAMFFFFVSLPTIGTKDIFLSIANMPRASKMNG